MIVHLKNALYVVNHLLSEFFQKVLFILKEVVGIKMVMVVSQNLAMTRQNQNQIQLHQLQILHLLPKLIDHFQKALELAFVFFHKVFILD